MTLVNEVTLKVAELLVFAAAQVGLDASGLPSPEVNVLTRVEIQEMICPGRECKTPYAFWNPLDNEVYLDSRVANRLSHEDEVGAMLVHELVHYAEAMAGVLDWSSCEGRVRADQAAYGAQNAYRKAKKDSAVRYTRPAPTSEDVLRKMHHRVCG